MFRRLLLAYFAITVLLGLRPFSATAYRWAKGTHWGAYNMFCASVERKVQVWVQYTDMVKNIDPEPYFWLNPLINTTHSHVDPIVVDRFAEFLANQPEVRTIFKNPRDATVHVHLQYRLNGRDEWQEIKSSALISEGP